MNENGFTKFMDSVPHDMELGKPYEWTCPSCGGVVKGARSIIDGSLWVKCTRCGKGLME